MNNIFKETCDKYGYVFRNNVLAFQKGPLSNWFGAYDDQEGGFEIYFHWSWTKFNCGEQHIMACKAGIFNDNDSLQKIKESKDPREQKALGRKVKGFDQKIWDESKENVAYHTCLLKVLHNIEILEFVKSIPRFAIIVEASPWDKIWGNGLAPENDDCYDITKWQGENLLGHSWMKVRQNI